MEAIRQKLRRNLSMHDKEANLDEHEDLDEETTGHLHKQLDEAEADDKNQYPQGRPGSFLNRLISHGNKKTEDQIAAEAAAAQQAALDATAHTDTTTTTRR